IRPTTWNPVLDGVLHLTPHLLASTFTRWTVVLDGNGIGRSPTSTDKSGGPFLERVCMGTLRLQTSHDWGQESHRDWPSTAGSGTMTQAELQIRLGTG